MTDQFTPSEMVTQMTRMGVPREKAEDYAKQFQAASGTTAVPMAQAIAPHYARTLRLEFPIRFTLPWSALISDNRKYGAATGRKGPTSFPRLVLTPEYRAAKHKARSEAINAMRLELIQFPALARPLSLEAKVFVPDSRIHDVCNFAKCAHDAMEGVIFKTDSWLHDVRWIRAGIDVDQPRAELTITPL